MPQEYTGQVDFPCYFFTYNLMDIVSISITIFWLFLFKIPPLNCSFISHCLILWYYMETFYIAYGIPSKSGLFLCAYSPMFLPMQTNPFRIRPIALSPNFMFTFLLNDDRMERETEFASEHYSQSCELWVHLPS